MTETRKLAAILVTDVVGYSRLASVEEERTLARLRGLRSDLIDPAIAAHHGRIVKRTGDGSIIEFRSVVDAVRCAIEMQDGMIERNAGVAEDRRIQLRVGVYIGDVVEESDGDLLGDGVNIASRLEGIAKPGAICLSEDAYRQVKGRLQLTVSDLGPTQLKNIAEPIRVYSLEVGQRAADKPTRRSEGPAPPRLSLVVLPFANMSGDPEQEYFVDGVTESLTTDLSRIRGSFVIGRNTAFTYKGKHVDLRQIGRELNVRYVLEGSVQRAGNRMRVSVQLIDAEGGDHLWAERFDKPLADLFEMQDEIVGRLANALSAQLFSAEARRAEMKPNPDSIDLCFQGWAWLHKRDAPNGLAVARSYFEQAVALDPLGVFGLIGVAAVDTTVALNFLPEDRAERLAVAEAALIKALSLDHENAAAHLLLGVVQMHTRRIPEGVRQCERALELDRNLAAAHAQIGNGKLLLGRAEETETHVQEALRLSPRDTRTYLWCLFAGLAQIHLGKEEEAVAWLRRSVDVNSSFPSAHFLLAAVLARLEQLPEAQAGLAILPTFTIARFRADPLTDYPGGAAGRTRIIDGLRKAGLAEE
jgi:TolB-like protein